jgi:lipopolysaccharide transport system permease protein
MNTYAEANSNKSAPLVAITAAGARWSRQYFIDLWQARELMYMLTWRDVKLRYRQTLLGAAWAILQPLLTMIVFWIFFGRLAKISSDGVPYALFVFAGLLPWTFFSSAVLGAASSMVDNSALINKVYFPRVVIPGAAILAALVDLGLSSILLAILLVVYHTNPGWNLLAIPLLLGLLIITAVGIGLGVAALNARYRDVRYALPFALQLSLFLTPVIYPASIVPQAYRPLMALNPMAGIIGGLRSALFNTPYNWNSIGISALGSVVLVIAGANYFRKVEVDLADSI